MELYLMQHGSSLSKEIDPEQHLSPVGQDGVRKSAEAIRKMGLGFDAIIASEKTRSQQTAAIVAQALRFPARRITVSARVNPKTPAEETAAFLKGFEKLGAVLVADHLPSLGDLASLLLAEAGQVNIKFENSGLLRLDLPDLPTHAAVLRWYLTPYHLQLIAAL